VAATIVAPRSRSQAIDVMRGITLALMIVVNMSMDGISYGPLQHAAWHGLTPTDLVFPSFLFIVGAALSYTLGKHQQAGDAALLRKVASRSGLIFLCGYLLYWFPFLAFDASGHLTLLPVSHTRIFGVLQRIGLTYGAAALVIHFGKRTGAITFSVVALLGYWALMHAFGDYSLTGNAGLKLDLLVLGANHMYHGEGIAFDPEGILSTLPAIVNVIGGYYAGRLIQSRGNTTAAISRLLIAGVLCIAVALAWNPLFPINKKLWTSSYVLCTIGIDLLVMAALVYVIDMRGWRGWAPFFEAFGKNTLFIYLLSEVGNACMGLTYVGTQSTFMWLYEAGFHSWASPANAALCYALAYMLCLWLVAWVLDRQRIYIRI
jgi:predicted acyltransferase